MHFRRFGLFVSVTAALALAPATAALAAPRAAAGTGYDVSYPQCADSLPSRPAFAIVGVSDGRPYGDNPCVASQYGWALTSRKSPGFYMNTANPGVASTRLDWYGQSGPLPCSPDDEAACAYDYGANAAQRAFDYAQSQTGAAAAGDWWLDVETSNSWSGDYSLNLADLQGSIDVLAGQGVTVGVYSTAYQWGQITGGARLAMPSWVAGAQNAQRASAMCASSFTGGKVVLVQYPSGGLDADYAC
ncbi:MAG TPA: hypothetical protein VHT97_14675 [Acidimicrobiales bacterium]|nr:hypothetical protein [Acidimicrobiales bacterium]